jgi:hypothetical protein
MNIRTLSLCLLVISLNSGCTTLRVRVDDNSDKRQARKALSSLNQSETLTPQAQWLAYGLRKDLTSSQKVGALSEAARMALPGAAKDIQSEDAKIYASAVRAVVSELSAQGFKDMDLEVPAPNPLSANQTARLRQLVVARGGKKDVLDPKIVDELEALLDGERRQSFVPGNPEKLSA